MYPEQKQNRRLIFSLTTIILSLSFYFAGALPVPQAIEKIIPTKIAQAAYCHDDVIELYADSTEYWGLETQLVLTSGNCKEGLVSSSDPRLVITDSFYPTDGCQSYKTTGYNTFAFAGITQPVEFGGFVSARGRDFGGECTDEGSSFIFRILPQGSPPDFSFSCNPPTQTITAGGTTSYNLTTTSTGGFNSAVTFNGSINPNTPSPPSLSFSNNGQIPPATTTAIVSTTSSTTPGSYTISFTGAGGGLTRTCPDVTLQVNAPPPTADIKANGSDGPISIVYNSAATISWMSTNTTSCSVSPTGWTGISGSQSTGNLTTSQTYSLSCSGPGGSASDSVTVNVGPSPPPTADIKCNGIDGPCSVPYNGSATISWSSTNASSCSVAPTGWTGTSNSGLSTGNLITNMTYTLSCTGPGGSGTDSTTVNVGSPPPTADIKANGSDGPITIAYNTAATIGWSSTNSTSCSISPSGWTGISGSQSSGNLTSNQTYTLSCNGPGGTANDSVTVNVGPAPDFSFTCAPPTQTVTAGGTTSFNLTTTPINGFNSQVTFSVGSMTPSVANPPTISFANNNQVPPATTTALVTTTTSTTPTTYTINFTGTGGGLTRSCPGGVTLIVNPNPTPTADIKANGSDSTITVNYGGSATISWSSTNATSCSVSPTSWTGTSGSQIVNNYTAAVNYNLSCSGPGGSATDNVRVDIGPDKPTNVTVDNSVCAQVTINWQPPASGPSPAGYNVYRSTDRVSWTKLTNPSLGSGARSYVDTTAPQNASYYYAVTAVSGGGVESTRAEPGITPVWIRACVSDLSTSDKDIVAINGNPTTYTLCNGASEGIPPQGQFFTVGDVLSFKIHICNSGDLPIGNLTVVDTMTNLDTVANVSYQGCSGSHSVSGNVINFNLGASTVGPNGVCSIRFDAIIITDPNTTNNCGRFHNKADIYSAGVLKKTVSTPAYLSCGYRGVPERYEVAP